jgi:hypothetical protein
VVGEVVVFAPDPFGLLFVHAARVPLPSMSAPVVAR